MRCSEPRDAPYNNYLDLFPRLAAKAAPAAFCCFFDFAGIVICNTCQGFQTMGPLPDSEREATKLRLQQNCAIEPAVQLSAVSVLQTRDSIGVSSARAQDSPIEEISGGLED